MMSNRFGYNYQVYKLQCHFVTPCIHEPLWCVWSEDSNSISHSWCTLASFSKDIICFVFLNSKTKTESYLVMFNSVSRMEISHLQYYFNEKINIICDFYFKWQKKIFYYCQNIEHVYWTHIGYKSLLCPSLFLKPCEYSPIFQLYQYSVV